MVKIKLTKARWPEEEQYVGKIFDAFKLEYPDYPTEYAIQLRKDVIAIIKTGYCEEIELKDNITNSI